MGKPLITVRTVRLAAWATLVAAVFGLIAGCSLPGRKVPADRETALVRTAAFRYPDFADDLAYDGLEQGLAQSLAYLAKLPPDHIFRFGPDSYPADHLVRSLETFRDFVRSGPAPPDLRRFIRARYRVYRAAGRRGNRSVLFTGYFEPILQGRRTPTPEYPIPVYGRPDDLLKVDLSPFHPRFAGAHITGRWNGQTLVPYYDRRQIEEQAALAGKAEPVAFLKSRIDLFFLQIQGSGKIYLPGGAVLNVHYHGTNGQPYRSIGRLLIEQEKIPPEEMSMQKIRAYLAAHPEEISAVLNYNPSYVFFKTEVDGPVGAIGVPLTPGRSVATDRRLFPGGALCYMETRKPRIDGEGRIRQWDPFSRFVLNQDTGGAIRGAGRADLFWGNGPYAEIAAGHLQHDGTLYFLVLKPDP